MKIWNILLRSQTRIWKYSKSKTAEEVKEIQQEIIKDEEKSIE